MKKSLVLVAFLALGAMACSTAKPADQPGEDVAGSDTAGDVSTGSDVTATDAKADTSDTVSKPDVADEPDVPPECTKNTDCNDNDPCTDNVCSGGKCSNPQNAGPCDDGDPCTQNDYCKQGVCAGKGTCTDVGDDTGPDATGDTNGDATGDTGPVSGCSATEWTSTLNDAFISKLGTCGQGCGTTVTAQCLSDCIATSASLSSTCADCFGDLGICVQGKCLMECIGGVTGQQCKDCAATNCGNALSSCVGHPAPNCAADADCDDKSVCTTDTCVNMFCTHTAKSCDDKNACTTDSCDKVKGCTSVALPTTVTCDDANACTEGDNCGTGNCTGTAKVCNDGNPCTDDSCNLAGACTTTDNAVGCDDGVTCTTADACASGACAGTISNAACNDGNPCTTDSCDAKNGCIHAAAGAVSCDDNNFCTVNDTCDGTSCTGSAGTPCSDSNLCTTDVCDGTVGNDPKLACSHADSAGKCDDGNACTADSCNPTTGCVNNKLSDTTCSDGNPNTVGDTCVAGTCIGSVPECLDVTQCDDSKSCTTDSCDSVSHTCKHSINAGSCVIDGACWSDGQTKVGNDCLACTSATSNTSWSVANETFTCGTAGTCASGVCKDPWPPTAPLANGKVCTLPTCDTTSKPAFYSGGNWTVTTTTTATTCNAIIQLIEPRANVGYSKTGKAHPMNFVGGCDYAAGGTTTQMGTIVSNVEATCETKTDPAYGVTYVETSIVKFGAGKGTGTATATLYGIPTLAGQTDNTCTISVQVTVQHVPDCAADGDCNDAISCTTDTCDKASGICQHALPAQTCLIDGSCYSTGDFKSSTGNGACRECFGSAPSQYGWVILNGGEPCGAGGETCGVAGACSPPP